jgi:hypothetical protein
MKSKAQDPWSFALWNNLPQLSLYQFKCWALIPVSRGQDKTQEDNSKQICWKFKDNENRAVVTGGAEASNPIGTRIDRKLKLEIHKLEFNRKEKRPWLAYKAARAWKPVSCDWNTLKSGSADSRGTAATATATNAALLLPTIGILTLPDPPPSWGSVDSVEQARIVVQADQNLFDCLLLLLVGNKHLQAAAVGDCNEQ